MYVLQLSLFVRIMKEGEIKHGGICGSSVEQILALVDQEQIDVFRTLLNLRTILQWECTQQRWGSYDYLAVELVSQKYYLYLENIMFKRRGVACVCAGLLANRLNDWSCTKGMIHSKIHLIYPGCPRPSIALQVQNLALNIIHIISFV